MIIVKYIFLLVFFLKLFWRLLTPLVEEIRYRNWNNLSEEKQPTQISMAPVIDIILIIFISNFIGEGIWILDANNAVFMLFILVILSHFMAFIFRKVIGKYFHKMK